MKFLSTLALIFSLHAFTQGALLRSDSEVIAINVRDQYEDQHEVQPVLVNDSNQSIFVSSIDGGINTVIYRFNQRTKKWKLIPSFSLCGTMWQRVEIKSGDKKNLHTNWGLELAINPNAPSPKGKFKVVVSYYVIEKAPDGTEKQIHHQIESKVFRISSKKKLNRLNQAQ